MGKKLKNNNIGFLMEKRKSRIWGRNKRKNQDLGCCSKAVKQCFGSLWGILDYLMNGWFRV